MFENSLTNEVMDEFGNVLNACGACGQFFTNDQADKENLHLADFCSAVDIYDPKCCEDSDDHEYSDDCECCINVCRDCAEPMDKWNPMKEYPTPAEMLTKLQATAPKGWIVSDEYHFIGVDHSALTDDQFISFGNVNGCFGFNDTNANTVCGDMDGIYNPDEIAKSFWNQVEAFYPELFKEQN